MKCSVFFFVGVLYTIWFIVLQHLSDLNKHEARAVLNMKRVMYFEIKI